MARPDAPAPIFRKTGRPGGNAARAEIRYCRYHGQVEFNVFGSPGGKPRWACKRCVGEAVTRRHQKVRAILVAEAGGCCAWCGYARCSSALHFHHVDPSTKEFTVNMGNGKGIEKLRREAEKCVLLCSNCHTEVEARLRPSPPPQATFARRAEWETTTPPPPWPNLGI